MPITFQIESSKVQEEPHVTSNRLSQVLVQTPPSHDTSLIFFMPAFSSELSKIDFDVNTSVPFPISQLNRYYFLYFEETTYKSGVGSSIVHLRG